MNHQLGKLNKAKGFTIVELLVVIVVIGILASITIVAYNGVTNRANASAAKSNAASVDKVVEAYAADTSGGNGSYPTLAQLNAYNGISKIPSGVTVQTTNAMSATYADGKTLLYSPKGTTGACIGYWDAQTGAVGWYYSGNASTGSNVSPFTCS